MCGRPAPPAARASPPPAARASPPPPARPHPSSRARARVRLLARSIYRRYVLPPSIFGPLERAVEHDVRSHGVVQLTPALATLASDDPDGLAGFVIEGERFDLDTPEHYLETLAELAK